MKNYTTTEDIVIVGRRKSKRKMPKAWRKRTLIPVDEAGRRRALVEVWVAQPTPDHPYPGIFLAIGFAKSYVLIPFRTPNQLDKFLSAFYKFMDQDVFAADDPKRPGVIEAWDLALEEARSLVAAWYDEQVRESLVKESLPASIDFDDSTTDDSLTSESVPDGGDGTGEG